MKVIWEHGEASVRDVYNALLAKRRIAYTTVMTMMNILEGKGYLNKRQVERAFVYEPAQPQQQVLGSMVREFVDRVFNGSAEPLLLHLVSDKKVTEKELKEIQEIVRKKS